MPVKVGPVNFERKFNHSTSFERATPKDRGSVSVNRGFWGKPFVKWEKPPLEKKTKWGGGGGYSEHLNEKRRAGRKLALSILNPGYLTDLNRKENKV